MKSLLPPFPLLSLTFLIAGKKESSLTLAALTQAEVPWSRSGLYGLSLAVGQQPVPNCPGHERGGRGKKKCMRRTAK